MAFTDVSPWALFEVEDADVDYSGVFSLSSDGAVLTVNDTDDDGRVLLSFFMFGYPGDVAEFSVEAECVSGTMECGVQAGTVASPAYNCRGGRSRDIRYVTLDNGAGFRRYRMRVVIPDIDPKYRVTWYVGGVTATTGIARFKNPRCWLNGKPVGAAVTSSMFVDTCGGTYNYGSFLTSNEVVLPSGGQYDGTKGFRQNPFLFNIGSTSPAIKVLGHNSKSSGMAFACYDSEQSSDGCLVRLFRSAASGPKGSSSGLNDKAVIGSIDALYDSGSNVHKRAGRLLFHYTNSTSPVFELTTMTASGTEDANGLYVWSSGDFTPVTNGENKCGSSGHKWSDVYATNGTIQTSDERAKTEIADIDESLINAWGNVEIKKFKFKDAIAKKGENGARLHIGFVAQDVAQKLAAGSIDPEKFGMYCYDSWDKVEVDSKVIDSEAVYDGEGNLTKEEQSHIEKRVVQEAGDSYGIRYEEALALECAYLRSRIFKMQEQIDTLVERVNQLTNNTNN